MPRKHKAGTRKRTRKERRTIRRERISRERSLTFKDADAIYVPSDEFTLVFSAMGGASVIGDGPFAAYDARGRNIRDRRLFRGGFRGVALVPQILGVTRDKAAKSMERADDAACLAEIRLKRREKRRNRREAEILRDSERRYSWARQDVPDQEMRSILLGSNGCESAMDSSDGLVVCFKTDDGRFTLASENWQGGWKTDPDGYRERVGVRLETMHDGFATRREAESAFKYYSASCRLESGNRPALAFVPEGTEEPIAVDLENIHRDESGYEYDGKPGSLVGFHGVSFRFMANRVRRLRSWSHNGEDMAALFKPAEEPRGHRGEIVGVEAK